MAEQSKSIYTVLDGYRFCYVNEIIHAEVFWPARQGVFRISQLLEDADGTDFGRVTLNDLNTNLIEGESCIGKLVPTRRKGNRISPYARKCREGVAQRVVISKDDESSGSDDSGLSHPSLHFGLHSHALVQEDIMKRLEEMMERLEQKLDRVLLLPSPAL